MKKIVLGLSIGLALSPTVIALMQNVASVVESPPTKAVAIGQLISQSYQ
jgi:hypothetical protein